MDSNCVFFIDLCRQSKHFHQLGQSTAYSLAKCLINIINWQIAGRLTCSWKNKSISRFSVTRFGKLQQFPDLCLWFYYANDLWQVRLHMLIKVPQILCKIRNKVGIFSMISMIFSTLSLSLSLSLQSGILSALDIFTVNLFKFKQANCLIQTQVCWPFEAKQSTTTFHLPCNNRKGIATISRLDLL